MNRKRRKQKAKRYWIERGAWLRAFREQSMARCTSAWHEALLNAGQAIGRWRRAWMVDGEVLLVQHHVVRRACRSTPFRYCEAAATAPLEEAERITTHQLVRWACGRCERCWLVEDGARPSHACRAGTIWIHRRP